MAAQISLTPAATDFNNIPVNWTGQQIVTIENTGDAALDVTAITGATSPFSVDFTAINDLQPGETATFIISYAPTATGSDSDTLTITSTDPNSPDSYTVTGDAVDYMPDAVIEYVAALSFDDGAA